MAQRVVLTLAAWLPVAAAAAAWAHPPSAIVGDREGRVFFVDNAVGVWKIEPAGGVARHPGPHFHWMAIDERGALRARHLPPQLRGDVTVLEAPTLVFSGGFPVAVAPDGALVYPEVSSDGGVRLMRMTAGAPPVPLATLPIATEVDAQGKLVQAQWIHGLAFAPPGADGDDAALYYTEQRAVRTVARDGTVTPLVEEIRVPGCRHPSGVSDDHADPALRDLEVAPDGTVYAAASTCGALLAITPAGEVSVALRGEGDWSPMGVAWSRGALYVLEYRYTAVERSSDWRPRVRRLAPTGDAAGEATLVADPDSVREKRR